MNVNLNTYLNIVAVCIILAGIPAAIANASVATRRKGYRKWLRILTAFICSYFVAWYLADLLVVGLDYGALMVSVIRPAIIFVMVLFLSNAIANWDERA